MRIDSCHPERSEGSQRDAEILRSAQDDAVTTSYLTTGRNSESRILNPALLIGYGSPYRRDDGVAFHVINAVRARLGRPALALDDTGEDDLGCNVDTIMAHQLVPELAMVIAGYERVIFVDASAGAMPEDVRVVPVAPDGTFQATTHHFSPGLLLSLALLQSGAAPQSWLLTIRGYDFDFGDDLSDQCSAHIGEAVEEALRLCAKPADS